MTAGHQHTWDLRRSYHAVWDVSPGPGWIPFGLRRLGCGCVVDDFSNGMTWEPCMAHEGDGHLAAISDQDGLHVARCLVLTCPWQQSWMHEGDAISAAQEHWRGTSGQTAGESAGRN